MLRATGSKSILDSSGSSESESEEVIIKEEFPEKATKGVVKGRGDGLSINKGYADRYNSWRNLEEQQKLKDRLNVKDISELNDNESDSDSTSEEDEDWSPQKEKAFLKTLAFLKKKDPKIYTDQFGFFKDGDANGGDTSVEVKTEPTEDKPKKAKPFTVRDHERTMVMEKGGDYSDEDEEEEEAQNKLPKSYNEELASIKTEISKAAKNIDSSDEDDDTLLGSKLLKKRVIKVEDQEKDQEQYKLWLKGELEKVDKTKLTKKDTNELKSLKDFWADDKLDEGEKFLRDYILNKKYIDPLKSEDNDHIPSYNEVVHDDDELSNDEKFEAEREEFEHKYNFRFEEPDQEFIKRYPRTIQDSLRREDTKRKEQRQKTKDRKEETISKKREEVQRLKALKRNEIMEKIQKLHDISGNPDLDLTEMDIDGDFNPEEYDRRMQEIFNDDYYKNDDDDDKPEFSFDEEIDGDDEEKKWEEWVPVREKKNLSRKTPVSVDAEEKDDEDEDQEQETEIIERSRKKKSVQGELIEASKGRRGRRKRSAFLDALEKEKPKFDPKVHKSFEEYFDEYYKLDFEDVVGGDLKCRFKYHKTTPNDFGLSVEEILKADDRELNQWASLKKTFQYRREDEEAYEVQAYKKKSEKQDLKKRTLASVYQPKPDGNMEEDLDEDGDDPNEVPKKKNKKKKNKSKPENQNSSTTEKDDEIKNENETVPSSHHQKDTEIKKKHKPIKTNELNQFPSTDKSSSTQSPSASSSGLSKRSKRHRKNQKKKALASGGHDPSQEHAPESNNQKSHQTKVVQNGGTGNPKKNPKNKKDRGMKRKSQEPNEPTKMPVDEDRLRAYGINPTKFKKRMKYGTSADKSS